MTETPGTPEPQQMSAPQQPSGSNGLAIAGMVLGIVALVLFCVWYISLPAAVVGLILSVMARKKAKETGVGGGMAMTGLVLSVIALAIALLIMILALAFGAAVMSWGQQMQQEIEQQQRNQQTLLLIKSYFA